VKLAGNILRSLSTEATMKQEMKLEAAALPLISDIY